jgi:hypothetical protein
LTRPRMFPTIDEAAVALYLRPWIEPDADP